MAELAYSDSKDPLLNTLISGRYRVKSKLGEGGTGVVYKGVHEAIGRTFAIKVLRPDLSHDMTTIARFRREAQAASAIRNRHIIEVTDMGMLPDRGFFMVLEYLEGRDLAQELRAVGPLPLARTARIGLQICDALAAVHAVGIVHRDLKAENIFLLDRDGETDFVKILDFGISKFSAGSELLSSSTLSLTQTGAILGTLQYLSPEQVMGEEIDHRADIYAFGVLLYRILTGRHPFEANSVPNLMIQITSEAPPPLREHREGLPEEVDAVIGRALAKSPEGRFASCAELAEALRPFAA